jgi:Na+-translocating ferredoxin:NAD+ oxidoreductase RnfG subunit
VFFAACTLSFQEVKLNKSALKKMDKSIKSTWEVDDYKKVSIALVDGKPEGIKLQGSEQLYAVQKADQSFLGYMILSSARGKYDYFDLMVLYNEKIEILDSEILVYREDFGGEIGSGRWLRQFIGKTFASQFKLDEDVQGISGATISVRSATNEIKRVTRLMEELKNQNKLNP